GAPTRRATGNLDLRYGVTPRWTVRAGLEQFWRDTLANRTHPYVTMVVNPTNAWAVALEAVAGASAGAGVQFEPSLNLQLAVGYTAYAHDTAPAYQAAGLRSSWALTGFLRPIAASGFFYLDGQLGGTRTATGATTAARLGASIQTHDVRLVPFVRPQHDVHVHALQLPPGGTDADAGQRADHRRDHGVAIRAGIGPLEPLQRAADVRARSLARAGRAHGPRVPR